MNNNLKKIIERSGLDVDNLNTNDFNNFIKEFIDECIVVMSEKDYHGEWLGEEIKNHFNINTIRLPANDLTGFLIKEFGGEIIFRVYNNDKTFIDYNIAHNDLEVKILSKDAYIYKNGDNYILDYSPEVLDISK